MEPEFFLVGFYFYYYEKLSKLILIRIIRTQCWNICALHFWFGDAPTWVWPLCGTMCTLCGLGFFICRLQTQNPTWSAMGSTGGQRFLWSMQNSWFEFLWVPCIASAFRFLRFSCVSCTPHPPLCFRNCCSRTPLARAARRSQSWWSTGWSATFSPTPGRSSAAFWLASPCKRGCVKSPVFAEGNATCILHYK